MDTNPTTDLESKLTAIKSDVQSFVQKAESVPVTNQEELTTAVEILGGVKTRLKRIEELRKFFVGPLNDQVKAINNKFKIESGPLESVEAILKEKMRTYTIEQERLAELERKKIAAAQKKSGEIAPIEVEQPDQKVRTATGLMSVKKVWTFEITNENKVPAKYWAINETLIREDIKNGEREIPGVKIFQDSQISIRQ